MQARWGRKTKWVAVQSHPGLSQPCGKFLSWDDSLELSFVEVRESGLNNSTTTSRLLQAGLRRGMTLG